MKNSGAINHRETQYLYLYLSHLTSGFLISVNMIFLIVALVLIFIIVCNVIVFHIIIRRAIKDFVKPALSSKNMIFVSYKWAGFFNKGDFREGQNALDAFLFNTGLNRTSIYSYIYYKDLNGELIKKVTIKIYRVSSSIENIVYCTSL